MKVILAQAAQWDEVHGSARPEFDDQLTAIATRCSDATNEVVALRGTHDDDRDGTRQPEAEDGSVTR